MKVGSQQLPGMTPSETKKAPKLGFSIDSLVGVQRPPSRDTLEHSRSDDSIRPPSPLSFSSVFPGSLLAKPEKPPLIQRPQPINGATHRPSSDTANFLLSTALQIPKGVTAPLTNPLLPPSLGFNPISNIPGIPLPAQIGPLLMGGGISPLGNPVARDYPLYPWLLSRHNRVFPQGLPSPEHLAYLLHPFRKPKRIRTAFSPNQLLKLEQAFEKNQYVVGTERKQLAHTLNLSETQVKVWFQNRRTKEKRSNTDGETPSGLKQGLEEDEDLEDDDMESCLEETSDKSKRLKGIEYENLPITTTNQPTTLSFASQSTSPIISSPSSFPVSTMNATNYTDHSQPIDSIGSTANPPDFVDTQDDSLRTSSA